MPALLDGFAINGLTGMPACRTGRLEPGATVILWPAPAKPGVTFWAWEGFREIRAYFSDSAKGWSLLGMPEVQSSIPDPA